MRVGSIITWAGDVNSYRVNPSIDTSRPVLSAAGVEILDHRIVGDNVTSREIIRLASARAVSE